MLFRLFQWFLPIPIAWILLKVTRGGEPILPMASELKAYARRRRDVASRHRPDGALEPATPRDAGADAAAGRSCRTGCAATRTCSRCSSRSCAVGLALFQVVAWLAPVLAPLGLGLFLAAMVAPLFVWMQGRGASAGVALALTVALVVVVGASIVWLLLVVGAGAGGVARHVRGRARGALRRGGPDRHPRDAEGSCRPDVLVAILRAVVGIAVDVGSSFAFAVVIAALLLLDAPRLSALVTSGLGSENPVFRETPALAQAAITYFVVRVRVNAVTAVSLLVLMLLVGVDYAPLWAVGAFFLSFVPYLGLIIALIAADDPRVRRVRAAGRRRDRHRRGRAQPRRGERPRADAHRAGAVALDLARVHDVLRLGLAAGAGRRAALDADHRAARPRPRAQPAHELGRGAAGPHAGDRGRGATEAPRERADGGPSTRASASRRGGCVVARRVRDRRVLVRAAGDDAVRARRDHRVRVLPYIDSVQARTDGRGC